MYFKKIYLNKYDKIKEKKSKRFREKEREWEKVGLCKPVPEPTRPTDADLPALPLQPTDGTDANDQNAKGHPMLVRCSHWSYKSLIDGWQTDPIYVNSLLVFQAFGYNIILLSMDFIFFTKMSSYWVLL